MKNKTNIISFVIMIALVVIAALVVWRFYKSGQRDAIEKNIDITRENQVAEKVNKSLQSYKILHVMSYHSPWEWTDSQFEGFKKAFTGQSVEFKTFQLDAKQFNVIDSIAKRAREAQELIDTWKPDLVYCSDDAAQEHVVKKYLNSNIPFVFSAVNADPSSYGYRGSTNVAGVLETEHFVETVNLLKTTLPSIKKIAVVTDTDPMWEPVMKRMRGKTDLISDISFDYWQVILKYSDFKSKIKELESLVDAVLFLGIFSFKDDQGKNVPYEEVARWTSENCTLPDCSFWKDRISFGTLCVVSVSGIEQGIEAGLIARDIIINGKKPSDIPMLPTIKGEPLINLARARQLGITIGSNVLLSAQVINSFAWE